MYIVCVFIGEAAVGKSSIVMRFVRRYLTLPSSMRDPRLSLILRIPFSPLISHNR